MQNLIAWLLGVSLSAAVAQTESSPALKLPRIADGPFKPDWISLTNYQTPEWFRDAKFGIRAHWGPQCEPEHGDWYARTMCIEGTYDYKTHLVESERGQFGGQSDVQKKPFTSEDIRFTQAKDGRTLYAIGLEIPADGKVTIKSLASNAPNWPGKIESVRLPGVSGKLKFTRDETGLHVTLPEKQLGKTAFALKIRA